MRLQRELLMIATLIVAGTALAFAQAAPQLTRVIGEVVAVDAESRLMSVKTEAGEVITLVFEEGTQYLRVPPGEKTLEKAAPTTLAEIGRGDRVYARGQPLPDGKAMPTRQLVVMARAAIEKKQDQEREEWRRRGIVGTIAELRPGKKEIVVQVRAREGPQSLVVPAADRVKFRRYAPDSVKWADARPSSFVELKTGDQIRALGEKSADGTTYKAEQIVTGSFRTIGGTITAVNAEANEIKVSLFPSKQAVTVVLNKDSVLRRFPKEFAAMMAQRMGLGPGGPPGQSGGGPPVQTGPSGAGRAAGGPPSGPAGPQPGGAPGGGRGMRMAGGGAGAAGAAGDDLLDRLPPLTLAELKPGDAVMVASTTGKDPARVTAIAFVSGVEAFLTAPPAGMQRAGAAQGTSLGMPAGMDIGIGLP